MKLTFAKFFDRRSEVRRHDSQQPVPRSGPSSSASPQCDDDANDWKTDSRLAALWRENTSVSGPNPAVPSIAGGHSLDNLDSTTSTSLHALGDQSRKRSLPLLKSANRNRLGSSAGVVLHPRKRSSSSAPTMISKVESMKPHPAKCSPTRTDPMPALKATGRDVRIALPESIGNSQTTNRSKGRSNQRPQTADSLYSTPLRPLHPGLSSSSLRQPNQLQTRSFASQQDLLLPEPATKVPDRIIRHLLPPPNGFHEDAFEERVDLIKSLVAHLSGVDSPDTFCKRGDFNPSRSQSAEHAQLATVAVQRAFRILEKQTEISIAKLLTDGSASLAVSQSEIRLVPRRMS